MKKQHLRTGTVANLAIVTAYNDMLSHTALWAVSCDYQESSIEAGGVAQVAGGGPAMCDGITQGRPGMELSLFSRDVIAMSAAIALSHDIFDAAVFLGICDKIVPGLVIAAQSLRAFAAVFIRPGRCRRPAEPGKVQDIASSTRRQGRAGKTCSMRKPRPIIHRERALLWDRQLQPM